MNRTLFIDQIFTSMVRAGMYGFLIVSILFSALNISHAQNSGFLPQNKDGFETGDWRNFRPHYIGDSDEWIRPQFTINDRNPISENYTLRVALQG
ncbi:MAG: hypothetical protein WD035_07700 [Balneolaceae bacterium]